MQEERMKHLVDRYYQGISTEGEEIELRKFFSKNSLPGFEAERIIFGTVDECAATPEPSIDLEKRINNAIDVTDSKSHSIKRTNEPSIWTKTILVNIAAVALTLIGTYIFFANYNKPVDTYKDPQIAYNETIKIFNMVSEQLNTGLNSLEPIAKMSNVASTSFNTVGNSVSTITNNMNILK